MKVLLMILTLISCQSEKKEKELEINWFKGSVESAFEVAKKENKKLFLYWGAVWCPPCNHLKKHVFTRDDFRSSIDETIPVYIDGDDPRAQIWGETFQVSGYPTTLILDASKTEYMRLSTEAKPEEYVNRVLDVLKENIPIENIIKKVLDLKASDKEWRILSGLSWYDVSRIKMLGDKPLESLLFFYNNSPENLKTSFYLAYLTELVKKEKLSLTERSQNESKIISFISNQQNIKNNFESIVWSFEDWKSKILTKETSSKLEKKIMSSLEKLRNSKELNEDQFLTSYAFPFLVDQKVNESYKKEIIEETIKMEKKLRGKKYLYQSVMSSAYWINMKANENKEAAKLLQNIIKHAPHPYYFMGAVSKIFEQSGNTKEALDWRKRAYKEAPNGATKIQWGINYLKKEMKLNDKSQPLHLWRDILSESVTREDFLFGRNKRSLKKAIDAFDKKGLKKEAELVFNQICQQNKFKDRCSLVLK